MSARVELLLPALNLMVLLLPVLLIGLELTSLAAIESSVPDFSADVAQIETPRVARPLRAAIHRAAPSPRASAPPTELEASAPLPQPGRTAPLFLEPLLGYGP